MSVSKSANSLYHGQRLKVVLPVSVISESVPIVLWEKSVRISFRCEPYFSFSLIRVLQNLLTENVGRLTLCVDILITPIFM